MRKDHPTIAAVADRPRTDPPRLTATLIRDICLELGADDAGLVRLDRPEMAEELPYIHKAFPTARAAIALVKRMALEPVRSPSRSVANLEFHAATHETTDLGRQVAARMRELGIPALATSTGFPMEIQEFPGRTWIVAHKVVAEAAGMGKIGIHRNVIHPKFGSFILLDTVLIDAEVDDQSQPIEFNPCLECKLCVAACPVGAIAPDGHFDSVACLNHNYREFMGGFIDWVDHVGKSNYADEFNDQETASIWQSLSFGPNYKSAYCMAACPAGEDVIGPFLANKARFIEEVLNPLQEKVEPVYVVPGSDAEAHVRKRFPHKSIRKIRSGVRPPTVAKLMAALPLAFQRGQAKGIDMTYHFSFSGEESADWTIRIVNQRLELTEGHQGKSDLKVWADSRAWVEFIGKRRSLPNLLLTRKLKFRGDLRKLEAFGKCFPG